MPRPRFQPGVLAALVVIGVGSRTPGRGRSPSPGRAAAECRPVVWVANGAGDLRGCSTSLAEASAAAGDPVEVVPFVWSHGYRQILRDQVDTRHAREQGGRLAAAITDQRNRDPDRRVVVVGHSAGAAVVLAATEHLPAGAIDRLILLAPSVSTRYDLARAACVAREGIDVFSSRKDVWALGVGVRLVGTTDGGRGPAAGRKGFRLPGELSGRVRQHFWSPEWGQTGHTGGHYGVYAPGFARQYLFPLMVGEGNGSLAASTARGPPRVR